MIKKLLSHVGEYKKATLLTPLFVTLEVILDIFIPLLMAMIVDRGINGRSQKDILWIGAALIASAILALIFGMLSPRYAATASAGFATNLRQRVFDNIK